ncbi:nucleotide-binding domain-containing protein [Athelia psychrophila]|uniref:Nucleotide-binding domain-containing protein n=1 Tax=Athelia psychrophila TaxID=1759441 RepID=A0A166RZZ3_9AGAM|nr:nucleotide-binding domain-containing protein [Fibularhizoctonia sp. CBS 109695]KZP28844.1 nucleotide-binding domain-containing protein [Fibularhizoctonia sp. CBS 109695]
MAPQKVVIMGAGVIGLTIAHTLVSDSLSDYDITIVSREMPEDLDSQGWAGPWAGANWSPMAMGGEDPRIKQWETQTYKKFWDMIPAHPELLKVTPARAFSLIENDFADEWYKGLPRDFRILSREEVPAPYKAGIAYTTLTVTPLRYLPFLKSQLDSRGVKFVRKRLRSIEDVADLAGRTGIVVNALGLGAKSLLGVQDTKMYPIRGQTILVQAPQCTEFLMDMTTYADDGALYIMPRPGADGTVLLGGTFQPNNWDTSHNEQTAQEIFARCAKVEPKLLDKEHVRILSHNVGLRPAREGGPRVEVEIIPVPLIGDLVSRFEDKPVEKSALRVVHAYGFGAAGYQESWGAAEEAANLVKSITVLDGNRSKL